MAEITEIGAVRQKKVRISTVIIYLVLVLLVTLYRDFGKQKRRSFNLPSRSLKCYSWETTFLPGRQASWARQC